MNLFIRPFALFFANKFHGAIILVLNGALLFCQQPHYGKMASQMKTRTGIETEGQICKKLFLTTNEVCQLLNMGKSCALALLERYGIRPVDLGKGRGKGLRWRMTAVIKLADILHTEAQTTPQVSRKKPSPLSLKGKSAKDLMAEFVGCKSPSNEVCNGN